MKIVETRGSNTFPNDIYSDEIPIKNLTDFSKNLWEYDRLTGRISSKKCPSITVCRLEPVSKYDIDKCSFTRPRFEYFQVPEIENVDHGYEDNFAVLHFCRGRLLSNFPQIVGGLLDDIDDLKKQLKKVNDDLEIAKKILGVKKETDFSNVLGLCEDVLQE